MSTVKPVSSLNSRAAAIAGVSTFVHQACREFQRYTPQNRPELTDDGNQSAGGARAYHNIICDLEAMVGLHGFAVSADRDFDE